METPSFPSDIFKPFWNDVYEPAEDTFLLLDALEKELQDIKSSKPLIVLEIGTGSGAVIVSLRKALGPECLYIATDINGKACEAAQLCATTNGLRDGIEIIQTNLTDGLMERLTGKVDLLIFNPPYVSTPESEIPKNASLASSWAGGKDGLLITEKFLLRSRLLAPGGMFFVVITEKQKTELTPALHVLMEEGVHVRSILDRRCGIEKLCVLIATSIR